MRQTLQTSLKRGLTAAIVVVQMMFYPMAAMAESPNPDVTSTDAEQQSQSVEATPATQGPTEPTGPQSPTGAESKTYTKNSETGLWENEHYSWDPKTGKTSPKQQQEYSYNPGTNQWDTKEWYYSPEAGKYVANTKSAAQNPTAAAGASKSTSAPAGSNSINGTGPNSNNLIAANGNTNATFNNFYDATISNKIGQLTQTGSATVQGNTTGGNAITGDATSIANLLNMIQSSWGGLGSQDISTFVADINGDITGDLYVDPYALSRPNGSTNLDVNDSRNAAITNDINVSTGSGNASVTGNTSAGDAKSGNANAVVNLMNMINSAITANKSFVGVLNINGSFNGDILLPPEMLQNIIAATGPNSNNQLNDSNNVNANLNYNSDTAIQNNIQANAQTGDANVTKNTSAGNASTGSANSNVVLLNLTGKRVVAKNAMVVFVNVLGTWTGLIMDAPAGTNAVVATGPGSNNTIDDSNDLTVAVDSNSKNTIINNVNVDATSGDATVSGNTKAGNATSGNATASVNVLNVVDSEFSVDDWFGVLFINVFDKWVGSFGVNTSAGTIPIMPANSVTSTAQNTATADSAKPATFAFVPSNSAPERNITAAASTGVVPTGSSEEEAPPEVLNSTSSAPVLENIGSVNSDQKGSGNMLWIAGIVTFSGVLMLGGERLVAVLRNRGV